MLTTSPPRSSRRSHGYTIVELMVAMLVGFIVLATGVVVLSGTFGSNSSALRMTRLNQDLRGILAGLTADLRRAGSWGLAVDLARAVNSTDLRFSGTSGAITVSSVARGTNTPNNAFATPFSNSHLAGQTLLLLLVNAGAIQRYPLTISSYTDSNTLAVTVPSGVTLPATFARSGSWTVLNPFDGITISSDKSCVLFSYDLDNDGLQDSNERFGYRRVSASSLLQATTTATSCDATATGWEALSDANAYSVTSFTVESAPVNTVTQNLIDVRVREYRARIVASLLSDTTVTRTVESSVQVRNHSIQ